MKTVQIWAAGAAIISIASLGAPIAAQASADGSKNTAIALGAAALYELANHKTTEALVLGAGAAVAAKQADDARKRENDRDRYHRDGDWNYSRDGRDNRDSRNAHDGDYYRDDKNYNYRGGDVSHGRYDNNNNGRDRGDYETRPNVYSRNDNNQGYGRATGPSTWSQQKDR